MSGGRGTAGKARPGAGKARPAVRHRSGTPARPVRKSPGGWRISRGRLLVLVAAFAGLAVLLTLVALLFSAPAQPPAELLTGDDISLQMKLVRRLSRELFSERPVEYSAIEFSGSEVESLLRLGDFASQVAVNSGRYRGLPLRCYELDCDLESGRVAGVLPLDTGWRWLFGGVIRVEVSGIFEKEDDLIDIDVNSLRIGRLPAPAWLGEWIAGRLLEQWRRRRSFADFNQAVRELRIEPGKLVLVYRPAALSRLLR